YLLAALLGGAGAWLNRRTPPFSRVLLAGAFASAYYMTYAMHFVPALRVVESVPVAIAMLALLVALFVVVADRAASATLTVLALFFGYYTSLVSGVGVFTLTANAVLAVAALVLATRHRWTPLSFGALVATYLAYVWWVGQPGWERLWERGLAPEEFRLRAAFLGLYWFIFTIIGLLAGTRHTVEEIRRTAFDAGSRLGWLTLNNALLLLLFAGLMRRTYPGMGWAFFFPFAGALCITAAMAYRRLAAERQIGDGLLWQGLLVGTLGLVSYFRAEQLVAVLAVESVLVLLLARATGNNALRWLAHLVFASVLMLTWREWPDRDNRLLWNVGFAGVMGWVNAALETRWATRSPNIGALLGAFGGTVLVLSAAIEQTPRAWLPWTWMAAAVAIAMLGALARTPAIVWSAHVPLVGAVWVWALARWSEESWELAPTLALVATWWGFGIVAWSRQRVVASPAAEAVARRHLLPYALLAVLLMTMSVMDHSPKSWRWAVWGIEALVLAGAGIRSNERLWVNLAFVPAVWGTLYHGWWAMFLSEPNGNAAEWGNVGVGTLALVLGERWLAVRGDGLWTSARLNQVVRAWLVTLATTTTVLGLGAIASRAWLTVAWACLGFVWLLMGLITRTAAYRWAGLTVLALALIRAVSYDLARLDTVYRVVTYLALGAMLLAIGFLYARWRERS
ncbi:MAG: DUF2339 domain-containing protein, partial [Verrucomicrobiae bacterium]|nr:DUF2339 domain-containing protein [Verrucomicrobiae bacterium]